MMVMMHWANIVVLRYYGPCCHSSWIRAVRAKSQCANVPSDRKQWIKGAGQLSSS